MIRNKYFLALLIVMGFAACKPENNDSAHFDNMEKTIAVDNWQFVLHAENLNAAYADSVKANNAKYVKVTLYASNTKTKKSLLFSIADDGEDYARKYRYLSFDSKNDLYIKYKNQVIYPIGYVFEPSNGLSTSERLVYKFQLDNKTYEQLLKHEEEVEYWYSENIVGLGKICFTHKS